jgi:hypothetical protein
LPPLPEALLREALRHKLLDFLCTDGVLDAELAQRMLKRRHSGFSVHNRVHTKANDAEGRQRLSRSMIRCPFSLEKMRYAQDSGMVIYRSKPHATLKRNYQLMPAGPDPPLPQVETRSLTYHPVPAHLKSAPEIQRTWRSKHNRCGDILKREQDSGAKREADHTIERQLT